MSLTPLLTLLLSLLVLLIGLWTNRKVGVLSRYNIPAPITGGLLFAIVASLAWWATDFEVQLDLTLKPTLLLMFFAGVGMSADLRMLGKGGKALALFLLVLLPFILLQNLTGIAVAKMLDLHPIFGVVGGSITLVGGHGAGAAYAQRFADVNNLAGVMDLSMDMATMGLIVGGLIGGPVAQHLIQSRRLRGQEQAAEQQAEERQALPPVDAKGMCGALAGILVCVVAGQWLEAHISGGPVTIPAFLWCMLLGVAIRNLLPFTGVRLDDRASELISGVCLSLFLVMTMMVLNLVEVGRSGGPFLVIIAAQTVLIVAYSVVVCFRAMGRDYEAAVTSAAFIGFNMGSTATAMANMGALTARYGPAPRSYLIVPLAGAFFMDLMNALLLTFLLTMIGG
jgi:glutamate:Na+ symporter, ESS family